MALTLVRLRWTLTLNQWRRSPFTLVMSVLGALYVLGMAAVAVTLLVTGPVSYTHLTLPTKA